MIEKNKPLTEGRHQLCGGEWVIGGTAQVILCGCTFVRLADNATASVQYLSSVRCNDFSSAQLSHSSFASLWNAAKAFAYHRSRVELHDASEATCYDEATGFVLSAGSHLTLRGTSLGIVHAGHITLFHKSTAIIYGGTYSIRSPLATVIDRREREPVIVRQSTRRGKKQKDVYRGIEF